MRAMEVLRLWSLVAITMSFASVSNGQVFTQADGAVEGPTQFGVGQALYGSFGADSANDPEFNIYRKYLRRETDEPLSTASNVDGNPGEAEWTDVNQRQSGNLAGMPSHVLTAPGMFIGTKNHKTDDGWVVSNPDQLLYLKPLIDSSGDVDTADSNSNAFWDTRFGFMEDPDAFIDDVTPNSNELDLWTGDFRTDAVYLQNHVNRDDSTSQEVLTRTGHGGSFKLHAADSQFGDERERQNYEIARTQAGTGEEFERAGFVNAGTAYADPVEVAWGMRLNDPENEDEILGREVEFWVKVGNVISSGIFDPGGGEDGELSEFPPNQDETDFSDFQFEWEEAVPVFFAGAQGLAQGTGGMGIFTPGDFGADGAVNLDDFNRLAGSYGAAGTTYSSGDFTQDGVTDEADLTAWAGLAGDAVKSEAVGAVTADVGGMSYDFNGSGATDDADVMLISDLFGVSAGGGCKIVEPVGDFDGDGSVGFLDFLALANNFGQPADSYSQGDADCGGTVDFLDFLALANNFGQSAAATAESVPEPGAGLMFGIAVGMLGIVRRRRS